MLLKKVFLRKRGFSLVELLVTVGIIGVLSGIAVPSYLRYKEESVKISMKTELSALSKSLNYAHSVDGGYHHSLSGMGYIPNKNLMTEVGFEYSRGAAPGCTTFPSTKTGDFSPFLTITKNIFDSTHAESATRASHLCGHGHCSKSDKVVATVPPQNAFSGAGSHAGCKTAFANKNLKCNCSEFIIFARSKVRGGRTGRMYTNEDGVFGYSLEPTTSSDPHEIQLY